MRVKKLKETLGRLPDDAYVFIRMKDDFGWTSGIRVLFAHVANEAHVYLDRNETSAEALSVKE